MNEPMIIVWLGVSRVLQADKMECLEQTEECMCMKDRERKKDKEMQIVKVLSEVVMYSNCIFDWRVYPVLGCIVTLFRVM